MKTRTTILAFAAAGLVAAAGYGLYWAGMNRGMKMASRPPGAAASASASAQATGSLDASGKRVLYWHDPMVPGQKFDKPGKSPFMDMQLVPVYAEDSGDEGTVIIRPGVQQNLGVRTATVTRGKLAPVLEAVGSVAYNERDVAVVQARSEGFVEKLHVRATLDPVGKGQALAEIYVPDWVGAQEEYLSVRRMAGTRIEALVDGARQRMRLAGMMEDQIRLVESTGEVHARLTVRAPIGGVVTELGAREGMTVMPGTTLFRINGLTTVWVNADMPESLAAQVSPGIPVQATAPALPGTTFKGRVSAILPEVDPGTRTVKARVELANPGGRLVPGMFATVGFAPAGRMEALLVPSEALIRTGKRSVVIVALDEGRFAPVDVQTGIEAEGQTEIRSGLAEGQKVVISGQFLIDSEASLRATTSRMGDAPMADGAMTGAVTHRGEGKIERIGKDEVTISHGPIPSLQWGPMTMGFRLPASGLPGNLGVGSTVSFEIREAPDGMFGITSISATAPGSVQPDAAGAGDGAPGGMTVPKK